MQRVTENPTFQNNNLMTVSSMTRMQMGDKTLLSSENNNVNEIASCEMCNSNNFIVDEIVSH